MTPSSYEITEDEANQIVTRIRDSVAGEQQEIRPDPDHTGYRYGAWV
jgi:hypothetical protein